MSQQQLRYQRFTILERIEHLVLIISFTTLGLTGLPQKYALAPLSQAVIQLFGGIETIRIIHHIAAAIFLIEAVYHIIIVGWKLFIQHKQATMLPGVKDGLDAAQWLGANLGFANRFPKMPRYNFMEKMEYWAMLWGLLIMALTGLMLWNPIATTNTLPGEIIPAAKAAHGGEAVLAVLAIFLWHFYNVHIKHWNWGMIKGTLSRHEMEEEHAQELEQIETGRLPKPLSADVVRQRLMLFIPAAALLTVALVAAIYFFLTFEKTAITTVPAAEQAQVFLPQTPTPSPAKAPTTTSLPQEPATGITAVWTGGVDQMLKSRCGSCHGRAGGFNVDTYQNVMKFVQPGAPEQSKIVQLQQIGTHPGQLTPDEMSQLIAWIQTGAAENPGGAAASGGAASGASAGAETWASGVQDLFKTKCSACHGTAGGFTATTYEDVMKQLKTGDPDNSRIVQIQQAGGHPGSFTADELQRVINWIKTGAPQQ